MKSFLKILFFLLICSLGLFAQDISGYWEGFLWQKSGGVSSKYLFSMLISQNNSQINGTTTISLIDDNVVTGTMSFSGVFQNSVLFFTENEIVQENKNNKPFYWCIKTGRLNYSEKSDTAFLIGHWKGIEPADCSPGDIKIKKIIKAQPLENTNLINGQNQQNLPEERKLKEGTILVVPSEDIIVIVSESAREDGDTISLTFNDKVILSNHLLTKKEITLNLKIDKSKTLNKLILFAHNVGDIPPNTVKIKILSGNFKQEIILKSDMKSSDVIYFQLEE